MVIISKIFNESGKSFRINCFVKVYNERDELEEFFDKSDN